MRMLDIPGFFWHDATVQPLRPEDAACVARVCAAQRFGVLATYGAGQPYASLVAFAMGETLDQMVFATLRATQKFSNLAACPRAALLLDSRTHQPDDVQVAEAVTALGTVRELTGAERARWAARYTSLHPQLQAFVNRPDCALCLLEVTQYQLSRQFSSSVTTAAP